MDHQLQGGFRPLAYLAGLAMMFFLLGGSPAFTQQKTPYAQAPTNTLKSDAASSTNQRILELALASKTKQGEYVIGSGDLLNVEVFDVPELTRDVRVNETGFIPLPLIPTRVRADGLTTIQLQDKIEELLKSNGLVSNPEVTVYVKEQRSSPITVVGAVQAPQVIQAGRQTNLLEVLSRAGGISADAGSIVMITRAPPQPSESKSTEDKPGELPPVPQTFTIGLNDLLDTGDGRFNIPIIGGDVVSVPRAGIVYVVGAVTRPGGFVMANDRDRMTALKVLALAGGTTGTAKSHNAIILRRNLDSGKDVEVPVDLGRILHLKSEDVTLQASDILYVPDSTAKKALRRAGDIAVSLSTAVALYRMGAI